jgi:GNAT superfamily N-acetyltransferase
MPTSGVNVIRPCADADFGAMAAIINAAATRYAGAIPADRYHVPYMPPDELRHEICAGVRFWGWYEVDRRGGPSADGERLAECERLAEGERLTAGERLADYERLVGVMGSEDVDDVTLIRHAYVAPADRDRGVGSALLAHLLGLARQPLLVGTWAAATWAVRFYEHHGFRLVTTVEKERLLRRYWQIPERQVETSAVLRLPEAVHGERGTP